MSIGFASEPLSCYNKWRSMVMQTKAEPKYKVLEEEELWQID